MFENAKHRGCVPAYCHVVVTMRPCVGRISSIVASSKTHPASQNPVRSCSSYWSRDIVWTVAYAHDIRSWLFRIARLVRLLEIARLARILWKGSGVHSIIL